MNRCYTMMRMKNKMKDSKAEFEGWWEVAKGYFTKELEKNLAQHNERILRYKLEAYKKHFPKLICGNLTSTERYWAKMKRMKQDPMEQHRRGKCRLRNHMISKVE